MLIVVLIGVAVFFADFVAVATIAGSLWLERWLGLSRGILLDWILIVAVCYGVAAWISGEMLNRGLLSHAERNAAKEAETATGDAEALARREIERMAALARSRRNRANL
jgi:hypothetical protein